MRVDRVHFARTYEASVLSLNKLTPHQTEKLTQCLSADLVHLRAPAGAGKTFVALNRIQSLLGDEPAATVLFVARNEALCIFVARWLCRRVSNSMQRLRLLRRLRAAAPAVLPRLVPPQRCQRDAPLVTQANSAQFAPWRRPPTTTSSGQRAALRS